MGAGLAPMLAHAQSQPSANSSALTGTYVSLTVEGKTKATPDQGILRFGVVGEAKTADGAMKLARDKMNTVLAALKAQGITESDIQTEGLNLNAQVDYVPNGKPVQRGYQARHGLKVLVKDAARLGPVLDAVVGAGVSQIDGIEFGLKNQAALEDQARQNAVQVLTQRAELYAKAAGLKVKRLVSLSEGSAHFPGPRPVAFMAKAEMMDAAGAPTSVSVGEQTVSVTTSAVFEIGN